MSTTKKPPAAKKAPGKTAAVKKASPPAKPKTSPPKNPPGRPSLLTAKLADIICTRLANGESLRKICCDRDMPDKGTVFRWLAANEVFRDQYAQAREEQADLYAEDLIDIADEAVADAVEVARNRLRMDARKWYASKLAPKKYGDKLAIGGAADLGAVQIERIERVIIDPEGKA